MLHPRRLQPQQSQISHRRRSRNRTRRVYPCRSLRKPRWPTHVPCSGASISAGRSEGAIGVQRAARHSAGLEVSSTTFLSKEVFTRRCRYGEGKHVERTLCRPGRRGWPPRPSGDAILILWTALALTWMNEIRFCSSATAFLGGISNGTFKECEEIRSKTEATGALEGDQCAARASIRLRLRADPPPSCTARSRMHYRSHGWTSHWVAVTREYMRIKCYA